MAAACSSALELEVQLEDASGSTARTNVKQHDIPHPAVKPLDRMHKGTGAMSAKFLSLYPEDVEFYYENGMGGTPVSELYAIYAQVEKECERFGITIVRNLIGSYITSLDMQGCSVTLVKADEEILEYWDAPVVTPGMTRWDGMPQIKKS
jgi:dihydroxyacetone kinase